MNSHTLSAARAAQLTLGEAIAHRLGALFERIARARAAAADRRALEALDDATLRDIGLARAEIGSAVAEAHRQVERTRRHLWMQPGGSG